MKPFPLTAIVLLLTASFAFATKEDSLSPPQSYTSKDLDISFPPEIAGMQLTAVTEYENEQPGLGVGLSYRAETKKADIYIYNLRQDVIPGDLDSPKINEHFMQVTGNLMDMQRMGHYKDVKVIVPKEKISLGPYSFLHATAEFTQDDILRISHLYLGVIKNQYVKIRFTYYASTTTKDEKALKMFLDDLSARFREIKQ